MDNFKAVYRILSALEKAMDLTEFDISHDVTHEISQAKHNYARYLPKE